jgi:zinc protease
MKKLNISALILTISLMLSAQAQKSPQPGTPKDFSLPVTKTFTLDNGLSVTLVPYGNIPKVTVSLIVRSGNINEAENEVWLADFTGNFMKEGTMTKSGQQIADEAAAMGGNLTVSTGMETTTISGDVLSEFVARMISLIADVAENPSFPASEESRLKNDLARDLSMQKAQPSNIAFELFSKIMFPGHPYGRIFPDQSTIESFNAVRAKQFHSDNFGARRSHIYIAGVFDEIAAEKAIRDSFDRWTEGSEPLILIPSAEKKPAIYFADRPGTPQAVVNIGLPVVDPSNKDYISLLLTNSLLGGSFTSRITMNIRENKGYTYSPYSQVSSRYRTAYWMEFAEVATDVTAPAVKEIFYEIKRLTNEPLSEEELTGIKNYMSGIFVLQNSTRYGIISQLAFLNLHGLDKSYLTDYVKHIMAVQTTDVQEIMKKYFNPAEMTIVIAGDRNKIGKGIAEFGKIEE